MAKRKNKNQFYAVGIGRTPGIYMSWDDCKVQTDGFKGATFKSFPTRNEALVFVETYSRACSNHTVTPMEQQPASAKRCKPHASAASVIAAAPAPPAAAVFQRNHTIGISLHFDGGSRGNPGMGGCGAQLVVTETSDRETTERVVHCSKFLGRVTNNEAEYHGIILGLEEALQQIQSFAQQRYSSSGVLPRIGECSLVLTVYGDSDLVIQQMKGNYKVNSPNLRPLHLQAKQLVASLHTSMETHIIYEHVYRGDNGVADALANQAMDSHESSHSIVSTRKISNNADRSDAIIIGGIDV